MKKKPLHQPEKIRSTNRAALFYCPILFTGVFLLQTCISQITGKMVEYVNDEAGFTATPGNHEITLDWIPDPSASGYTVYFTTNGSLPSENYGELD